jgi:hypothetical protein
MNLTFNHPLREIIWIREIIWNYDIPLIIDYNIIINNNINQIKAIHEIFLPVLCKYKIINELLLLHCKDYFNENKTTHSKYKIKNYFYYVDV